MNRTLLSVSIVLALLLCSETLAQEKKAADAASEKTKEPASQASAEKPTTTEEREAKFKATMTKATMSGRWCSIRDGVLGEEKSDKYTIIGVTKLGGDNWIIQARVQFNKQDIVAPIPIQVKWAGDTPVTARVLIYEHTYAGTWSGGNHGGLMNGIITNEKE